MVAALPHAGPPVSAVVCNYNGEHYLRECLGSLMASEYPLDEILVVDNGSTDASVELVRADFPMVRLLRLHENGGPCVARNAGVRAARNRLVLAVDNDAMLLPDTLAGLVEAVEDGATAAQPRSVYADEPGRVHYDGGAFHYVGLYSLRNFARPLDQVEGQGVVEVDGLIAICILFDREPYEQVGGYDEDLFILFEDLDLSMRLRIAGHRLVSVEDRLVRHRGGTPGISFRGDAYPKFRAYYHSRNRWLVMVKNYRLRTLLAAFPGVLVYEAAWALFTLRSGHFRAHLAGKFALLGGLWGVLARRREVQARRRLADRELFVEGPLTFSPQLVTKPSRARMAAGLDRVLRVCWRATRWLAG